MITEEYLKNHLITAFYIDNERRNIEIHCRDEDGTKVIPTVIQHDKNHPYFQALTKFISEDELVEITPNHIRLRKKHLTENERKRSARQQEIKK